MVSPFETLPANLLASGAGAYASRTATVLLEENPPLEERYRPRGFALWKNHLATAVRELAVAVDLQCPALFAASVDWSRQSFQVRQVPLEDLRASLQCLRRTLAEELPAQAKGVIDATLEDALAVFDTEIPPIETLDAGRELGGMTVAYLEACVSGQTRRAEALLLEAAEAGRPVEDLYLGVLVPAQREIGRLWHAGDVGIHEEHVVSTTTQRLLTLLAHLHPRRPQHGKTVVGAAVQDNNHDIGVRVVTELFALNGWNAIHLGTNLPAADLARAAHDFEADLVVLSVALIAQLEHLRPTIAAVREAAPDVKILLGGLALTPAPDLWRTVEAHGHAADAEDAVRIGAKLVGLT